MKPKHLLIITILVAIGLVLAACTTAAPEPTACPECPAPPPPPECPEAVVPACPECPAPPPPPECPAPVVEDVPFEAQWVGSGHADTEAGAFTHWDKDDPAEIPTSCARCHSTPGYLDFIGEDGSEAGVVDAAAPIGTTVECAACHNDTTAAMTSVTFPSGAEITGLGREARCMVCHQGRASVVSVNGKLEELGLTEDLDTANEELGFINIHYFAAGATRYGQEVQGGYEYDGKEYDPLFNHVEGYSACIDCHNPHTLELKIDECADCHTGVTSHDDLEDVRMNGSLADYDGDGDTSEGIYYEIESLQSLLNQAIQAYASEVAGAAIVYDSQSYPYFFIDTNADGEASEDEANYGNKYDTWTGRLLKAAYNYQVSVKDPGAFAHGGKYVIELLYDSIEDLNTVIASPVDLSAAHRTDAGHFAASMEAFRHWDEDGEVRSSCARCHSASGLPTLLKEGVNVSEPLANGLMCTTCHDSLPEFTRRVVDEVEFPSGASLTFGEGNDANLCLLCHQARNSKSGVDSYIAARADGDDEVSDKLSFRNPHYFPAGATLFGADAAGAYEYDGQTYNSRFLHVGGFDTCIGCHDTHALEPKVEACAGCHGSDDPDTFRMNTVGDFDGDGDDTEGLAGEVETMHEALYTAIQAYAADTAGTPIVYNSHRYPYFFDDAGERYGSWTPRSLRAAYNYQWVAKDPGAFAHNGAYMLQILYDSLNDLGAAAGMTRP